jgi:hypothetical protein
MERTRVTTTSTITLRLSNFPRFSDTKGKGLGRGAGVGDSWSFLVSRLAGSRRNKQCGECDEARR